MFRIFTTCEFDKDFDKLDKSDKNKINNIMNQLSEKGDKVGKPLGRFYFREKRFKWKRLYFLVYRKFLIILAVGISNKKMQQGTIDNILSEIKNYESFIMEKLKNI